MTLAAFIRREHGTVAVLAGAAIATAVGLAAFTAATPTIRPGCVPC